MTLVNDFGGIGGGLKLTQCTVTGPASYVAGGFAVTAADFGLGQILEVLPFQASGYVAEYIAGTGKILVRWTGATTASILAEITNATDISAVSFKVLAIGRM